MTKKLIIIPHLKKMAVKNLPAGHDPSNPPLTAEALMQAESIPEILSNLYGSPGLIATSTRLRALQTAEPSIQRFPEIPIMELSTLGQPDSGEEDRENSTRPDGLVIYGRESTKKQWMGWSRQSLDMINAHTTAKVVWVFTHSTIAGAFKLMAINGMDADPNKIDDFDQEIKPFLAYQLDGKGLSLLPKPMNIKF